MKLYQHIFLGIAQFVGIPLLVLGTVVFTALLAHLFGWTVCLAEVCLFLAIVGAAKGINTYMEEK